MLLLTTPCFAPQEQPDGSIYPFDDPARVIRYNQLLRQAAARASRASPASATSTRMLCPGGHYQPTINGVVVRTSDGVHITEAGGAVRRPTGCKSQIIALGSVHAGSGSPQHRGQPVRSRPPP